MDIKLDVVRYGQCEYDWNLVSKRHGLVSEPLPQSTWQSFPDDEQSILFRRMDGYFQWITGEKESGLFKQCLTLEPMKVGWDANWLIEKHGDQEYLVRSTFSRTYGPVDEIGELDAIVEKFDVFLENKINHVWGSALFKQITAVQLLDACRRLQTIERWCININDQVNKMLANYWSEIKLAVERDVSEKETIFDH